MSHPADTDAPLDTRSRPTVENEAGETSTEGQAAALSALSHGNGIDVPKENSEPKKAEVEQSTKLPVTNVTSQTAIATEQEVQSPVQETDGNKEGDAVKANGDASGNVQIPSDADLAKPVRDGEEQRATQKARRSSTLSTIAEKTKTFIPRGRVHKRTGASHGRRGGGCVIF